MTIVFVPQQTATGFIGTVVELEVRNVLATTTEYANAETAKSAAVSLWRAKQAAEQRQQAAA